MAITEQTPRVAVPVRQRLLDAAEDLYYAHGIASVGVDAVVSRAGVATASLYHHFAGKDGLVAGYLSARDQRWRQHWEDHVEGESDPHERVLAVFTALDTWSSAQELTNGCAHLAALQQLPADHPGATASRAHKQYVRKRFTELVTAAGCPETEATVTDLLLIYEGTLALHAASHDSDAVCRGRLLARWRLEYACP